ncbi:MAG TPA: hypothetical protein VHO28_13120, partial [Ignavibacteriales bacterium]|nr:hypothetical protein [Ignavibacteriales bacterium]
VKQMELEQPYVSNYITFAYSHYNSPLSVDPGFHKTYVEYVKTGKLESSAPSMPGKLKASSDDGEITLSWKDAKDNIGVCGYNIYRDGKIIFTNKIDKMEKRGKSLSMTEYVDKNVEEGAAYTYQIQAYDFANNVSALSEPVTIKNED